MVRDGPSEGEGWSRDPSSKTREADSIPDHPTPDSHVRGEVGHRQGTG